MRGIRKFFKETFRSRCEKHITHLRLEFSNKMWSSKETIAIRCNDSLIRVNESFILANRENKDLLDNFANFIAKVGTEQSRITTKDLGVRLEC